jgi:hypothetical protein
LLGSDLQIGLEFTLTVPADGANALTSDLRQILNELGLGDAVKID